MARVLVPVKPPATPDGRAGPFHFARSDGTLVSRVDVLCHAWDELTAHLPKPLTDTQVAAFLEAVNARWSWTRYDLIEAGLVEPKGKRT